MKIRFLFCLLTVLVLLGTCVPARGEGADIEDEEIDLDAGMLSDTEESAADPEEPANAGEVFTPSYGSPYRRTRHLPTGQRPWTSRMKRRYGTC